MSSKVIYEVGVRFDSNKLKGEAIRPLLAGQGFVMTELVEQNDRSGMRYCFYVKGKRKAYRFCSRIRSLKLRGASVYIKKHRETDWSSRWKKGWRPFALTKRFHVIPLWQRKRTIPAGKEHVFIETTNAFGTGLHETTRLVAEVIERRRGKFDSFLDVGTGTGILTIVALKCGARRAVAFDIDPAAVRAARDNIKANRLSCRLKVADVRGFRFSRPFHLVAANLVSADLVDLRDRIVSFVNPGGTLVISGISLKRLSMVKKAFALPGLTLREEPRGREWAALVYQGKIIK